MTGAGDEYGLLMPFIATKSNGGTYDDDAYVAGWEMGALEARLSAAGHFHLPPPAAMIHRENVAQADLLAMRHGMVMSEVEMQLDDIDNADEVRAEWAHVDFSWAPTAEENSDG